jgi:hypothetical protein
MYKDKKFRVRAIDEVMADITAVKHTYGNLEKVFL